MGKQRNKKQRAAKQHGMDVEGGGGGGDDGWTTAPVSGEAEGDFIGMDTTEAGQPAKQPGEKVDRQRGKSSSKQASRPWKARKRKSLEKALAVASRTETKVTKSSQRQEGKKGLKKLWQNEGKEPK